MLAVEDELTSLVMHRRPRGYDARVSLRCQLSDFELGIQHRSSMPVSARVLDIVVDRVIVSRNRLESGGMRIRQCAAWRAEYVGDA